MKKWMIVLAVAGVVLTGCRDSVQHKSLTPVTFDVHDRCNLCGMVIAHYAGPKAELFIKGAEDTVVKFCSGRDAFTFALQPENARRLLAFYVHDMGETSWDKPEDKALIDATRAHYVYGHNLTGVMGNEPAAFSSVSAARSFVEKHGGKVYSYTDVTLDLLDK